MIFAKLTVVSAVAAVAYGQTTGKLGDAAEINDNPVGTAYVATFTPKGNSNLTGTVLATSGPGGEGVHFSVSVSGLPADQGPFGTSSVSSILLRCSEILPSHSRLVRYTDRLTD